MNWDAIGALSELFGAIAVVATLIYLAIQIRQTKESSRTQAYHLAIEQLVAGVLQPDMALLWESEHRELTETERQRLVGPLGAFIYGHEVLHYLWKKGQVDDELWQNIWLNNKRVLLLDVSMSRLASREGPLSRELLALLEREKKAAAAARSVAAE